LAANPPNPLPDADLSPEEIERRAGEIARRLMNTPPVKHASSRRRDKAKHDAGTENFTSLKKTS